MSSKLIAKNSFWYGLDTVVNLISGLVTSIAIARVIGPEKLGYFVYVGWLTNVIGSIGTVGIPAAASKYMAEYLGRGEAGLARAVFFITFRLQAVIAVIVTGMAVLWIQCFTDDTFRLIGTVYVSSMLFAMLNAIATAANTAAENMAANVPGSLISTGIYAAGVTLSLCFGWGLLGLAATVLSMRAGEFLVRMVPVWGRMRALPNAELAAPLRRKLFTFSGQSLVLLLLTVIVWDRSEVFFLRNLCADIRQVAFYSVVFNITERLLLTPVVFASAAGSTLLAQFGRDPRLMNPMAATTVRYLALIAFPVHLGLAAISGSAILLIYGSRYSETITLMTVAAILAMPRALLSPITTLLTATENQRVLVKWNIVSAILNLTLDFVLIPRFGAMGAVIANGVTQLFATSALFFQAVRLLHFEIPWNSLARIATASLAMAGAVKLLPLSHWRPLASVAVAVPVAALAFLLMVRFTKSLQHADSRRFSQFRGSVPAAWRSYFDRCLGFLIPEFRLAGESQS